MTIPAGALQRELQQAIDRVRQTAAEAAANLQAVVDAAEANAQTEITDSVNDRAQLHQLCGWFDTRLQTLEGLAGITAPPNPTLPPPST